MPPEATSYPLAVRWTADHEAILLLDQTRLPDEERYLRLASLEEVAEAITSLRVRGAPAIGITAAMGLAMAMQRRREGLAPDLKTRSGAVLREGFVRDRDLLLATRPTAVNLAWAMDRMDRAFRDAEDKDACACVESLILEAERIAREDREMCRRIGDFGADLLPPEGTVVLTHCNAGALATGGMGTALAPIYTARERGIPVRVFADETRPVFQGARLTAWELQRAGVDVTVVTDSMAAVLMKEGRVNLVIVGADRVAANGDVANKIGTYGLAVLARHHGIPFYVALPRSTFDPTLTSGDAIPIEERNPEEVQSLGGRRLVPRGGRVWNPAFDVTPAHFVTAFITDGGVLRPPFPSSIGRLLADQAPRSAESRLEPEKES